VTKADLQSQGCSFQTIQSVLGAFGIRSENWTPFSLPVVKPSNLCTDYLQRGTGLVFHVWVGGSTL
jgi:hypothetical protein